MTRWYLKLNEQCSLSQESIDYIESLKPHKAKQWDLKSKEMKKYKEELLSELMRIQDNRCVYCGLSLLRVLVDREHFVPKSKKNYYEFTFHPMNLFAACTYCNRRLKGTKSTLTKFDHNFELCKFSIVHPVLEDSEHFIEFIEDSEGEPILVKSLNKKGEKTINMFGLDDPQLIIQRSGYLQQIKKSQTLQAQAVAYKRS